MSLHLSRFCRVVLLALAVWALAGLTAPLFAADIQWSDTTGDFNSGSNWAGGAVPGSGDNAILNNGGNVRITSDLTVVDLRAGDASSTANGTITQTGGNAMLNGWLRVGSQGGGTTSGTGTYVMSGGTLKTSGNINLGEIGGTGTMTQTGGTITSGTWVSIGQGNVGTYNLSAGTLHVTTDFNVSDNANTTGTLSVSGTGAITTQNFYVGKSAGATAVVMQTGGTITSGPATASNGPGGLVLASNATSKATYTLAGGALDAGGSAIVGGPGAVTFNFTGGTLQNASSVNFPLSNLGGTLHPGPAGGFGTLALGTATTNANYAQGPTGNLLIDIHDLGDKNDKLAIDGSYTLSGDLLVHVVSEKVPPAPPVVPAGDTFTILTATTPGSGKFSNALTTVTADNGQNFSVNYGNGSAIVLTALPVPEPAVLALLLGGIILLGRRTRPGLHP